MQFLKLFEFINSIYRVVGVRRRWQALFLAMLSLCVGIVELGVAGALSLLGLAMSSPEDVGSGWVFKALRGVESFSFFLESPSRVLITVLAVVTLSVFLKNIMLFFSTFLQQKYSTVVESEVSAVFFDGVINKQYLWHINQNSSKLMTIYGYRIQVGVLVGTLFSFITQIVIGVILLLGGLVMAAVPMVIVVVVSIVFASCTYMYSRKRAFECNSAVAKNNRDLNGNYFSALQGIREVKVFSQQRSFIKINERLLDINKKEYPRAMIYPMLPVWVLETAGVLTLLLALVYLTVEGAVFGEAARILALLAGLAWRLMPCVNKIISCLIRFRGLLPYLEMFFGQLDERSVRNEMGATSESFAFKRELLLDGVSFRYPHGDVDALNEITLSIKRGCMVGVIGCSGAGKSTLLGVLTGLFAPEKGCIKIDGATLEDERESALASLIGYVPQSPYLMHATLAENVAFSEWGKPVDNERVLRACRLAAVDFIDQLPEGLNTLVGERGVRLSGGQAQRVAIARALYSEPQLVVFDEATSALDGAAEGVIQKTVNSLRDSMTLVIIAHRLSTVENCDILYWLEEGRLKEVGTPAEVLPRYGEMLKMRETMGLEGGGV